MRGTTIIRQNAGCVQTEALAECPWTILAGRFPQTGTHSRPASGQFRVI